MKGLSSAVATLDCIFSRGTETHGPERKVSTV